MAAFEKRSKQFEKERIEKVGKVKIQDFFSKQPDFINSIETLQKKSVVRVDRQRFTIKTMRKSHTIKAENSFEKKNSPL